MRVGVFSFLLAITCIPTAAASQKRSPKPTAEAVASAWLDAIKKDDWETALSLMTEDAEDRMVVTAAAAFLQSSGNDTATEELAKYADADALIDRVEKMMKSRRPSADEFASAAKLVTDRAGLVQAGLKRVNAQGMENWMSGLNVASAKVTTEIEPGYKKFRDRPAPDAWLEVTIKTTTESGSEDIALQEDESGWLIDY